MTADPFEAARVTLRKLRELKPVRAPDWHRAERLHQELQREAVRRELRMPDDDMAPESRRG